jgi:hypothetical protein
MMKTKKIFTWLSTFAIVVSMIAIVPAGAKPLSDGGVTRQIPSGGTTSLQTGDFTPSDSSTDLTQAEFPGQMDAAAGPGPYQGTIVNRSFSSKHDDKGGNGESDRGHERAKSNPVFNTGFEGLNLFQQRYARGGNQFTVEPPDQGLCVGNGYVVEAVNDVLNVYSASTGQSVLPDNTSTNIVSGFPTNVNHAVDLNSFFGYAPAINRSTGVRAQFVTDPSCLYDAATGRFFVTVLTLETYPNGAYTLVNHIDTAVSNSSDPTGTWTIYRVDVTNDGTDTGGVNPGPYLGDYPHIGADANGYYITTNAYPWNANGFAGAQVYAFSKAQMAAGAANVTMVHLDTSGLVNAPSDAGSTQPGFTVWPAQSPANQFNNDNGGTEFFLSSNAADEATHPVAGTGGSYTSNQLVVWKLSNTSSLNSASPALSLSNKVVGVEQYAFPPKAKQPGSGTLATTGTPQGYCINDTTTQVTATLFGCWKRIFGVEPAHDEVISTPDSNDTRMQQVSYANGKLWGALDTAFNPDGGAQRAGVAYFILNPESGKVVKQGYFGATGYDFTYPAIAVTQSGRGVMAFTATGDNTYPSAGYAAIDAKVGVSAWNIVPNGQGQAQDDGFTSYKSQVGSPPRTRWGDYSAAAVDGKSIWIASEYVAHACDYTTWGGQFFVGGAATDNKLGTCASAPGAAGTRVALGNWSTYISKFTP